MTYGKFRGYSEISNFNQETQYFHKKVYFQLFKKCYFGGCDVKNWVWTKLALWICPILWIRVKIGHDFFGDPWWPTTPIGGHQWGHQGVTKERFWGSPIWRRGSPNILNVQNGSKYTVMDWCLKLYLESLFGSIRTIFSCLFTPHHYHIIKITLWWNCFSDTKIDAHRTLYKGSCMKQ